MIVIPMAGLSSRFTKEGYTAPKYMLEAKGRTLFAHAVSSFLAYAETMPFLFIARNVGETKAFILLQSARLGIRDIRIIMLDEPTSGQAETVSLGLKQAKIDRDEELTIFNIDTFRPGFRFPAIASQPGVAGYLEVFRGSGANWSYVCPLGADSDQVIQTTEKVPVSDLCCTGLYHFSKAGLFMNAYRRYKLIQPGLVVTNEHYIAPMYNILIADGLDIRYSLIDRNSVIFCGVPSEYLEFASGHNHDTST